MKLKLLLFLLIVVAFFSFPKDSFAADVCWDGGGIRLQDGVRLR